MIKARIPHFYKWLRSFGNIWRSAHVCRVLSTAVQTPSASFTQPSKPGHNISVAESEFILKQVWRRSNVLRPRNVPLSWEKFHGWSQDTLGWRARWAFCPGFDICYLKTWIAEILSLNSRRSISKNLNLIQSNQHPLRRKMQKFWPEFSWDESEKPPVGSVFGSWVLGFF